MRNFASDNYATALPEALDAIAAANHGPAVSYGADEWTARLQDRVREQFGPHAAAFPVFNGTGANVTGLRAMLKPWQGVICAETAHLNVDEGGAPEVMGAIKLLQIRRRTASSRSGCVAPDGAIGDERAAAGRRVGHASTELARYTPQAGWRRSASSRRRC